MKKILRKTNLYILIPVLLLSIMLLPPLALAQNFGLEYINNSDLPTSDVRDTVITLINVMLGILGIIVLVGILYGGFMVMTAGGDTKRSELGRKAIANFAIGLLIIFLAFAITNFVFTVLGNATGP